jgi:hypothetical protein
MSDEKKKDDQELDEAALERVSGGAVDAFVKLDGTADGSVRKEIFIQGTNTSKT